MLRPLRAFIVALLLAAAATASSSVIGQLPTASAHAELISSTPADGATLAAAPSAAVLTYSDPIDQQFVKAAVTGPGGTQLVAATSKGPVVTVPVPAQGPGHYRLAYRVVSADGHPVSGQITWTVSGTPTASPPPSGSVAGGTSGSSSTQSATQVPAVAGAESTPAPATAGGGGPSLVLIGFGVLAFVVIAGGLAWVVGRRRQG